MTGLLSFNAFRERLANQDAVIHCPWLGLSAPRSSFVVMAGPGKVVFRKTGDIEFEVQAAVSKEQTAELHRNHLGNVFALRNLTLAAQSYDGLNLDAPVLDARLAYQSAGDTSHVFVRGTLRLVDADFAVTPGCASASVIYSNAPDVPLTVWNKTEVTYEGSSELLKREAVGHVFHTKGTTVEVRAKPAVQELELRALAGEGGYQHPFLEGLLLEPFRALNGTNQCPRFIVRDFGDGRARVVVYPQERHTASLGGAAAVFQLCDADRYWGYFSKYLDYLAEGSAAHVITSPIRLTLFHDEINRAIHGGSHWLVSLALSSAIEGLLRTFPDGQKRPPAVTSAEHAEAQSLVSTLSKGPLKEKLLSTLKGVLVEQYPSGTSVLSALVAKGVIETKHKKAWGQFRHYVAHGNLFAQDEPDERLPMFPTLYELFQLLTASKIGFNDLDFKKSVFWREAVAGYPALAWFVG